MKNTKIGDTGLSHSTNPQWQDEHSENVLLPVEPLEGVLLQKDGGN